MQLLRRPHVKKVFLSYRRDDTGSRAQGLHDRLTEDLGRVEVFMDLQTIHPGEDFPRRIADELATTNVVLVLIGGGWSGVGPGTGRRIDDERDFVRIEVATALEVVAHVLPVLVDGARMPAPDDLPLDLGMIARLNALPLRDGNRADAGRIVAAVDELLRSTRRPAVKVPPELVGTWVSAGMGDAVQQYDFYANGTYQFVGITRQAVSNGVFEFEVFHEGAATVDGDSITFEAFRGTARRDHPEHPSENYADDLRPQTATSHWRLQPRGGERYLVLGDGATPAVVYRFLGRSSTPVRARNRPPAPTRVGADTASGELVEWFPLFGEEVSARVNRRTGWKVLSTPGDPVVHVFDPGEVVHDVDVSGIPKNGTFVSFSSEGRRLPIEIGWYPGGTHRGTRQDGTYGPYTVPAGYVARWVDAP